MTSLKTVLATVTDAVSRLHAAVISSTEVLLKRGALSEVQALPKDHYRMFVAGTAALEEAFRTNNTEAVYGAAGACSLQLALLCKALGLPASQTLVPAGPGVHVTDDEVFMLVDGHDVWETSGMCCILMTLVKQWQTFLEEKHGRPLAENEHWPAMVAFVTVALRVTRDIITAGEDVTEIALQTMRDCLVHEKMREASVEKGSN